MRPVSIDDIPLVDALADVFSRYGYEGASLNRLSDATGLKRASLYHRFPGGKDEIVEAVIARGGERFAKLLAPAYEEGSPKQRAEQVAAGISEYYQHGEKSCLIVAMSVSDSGHRAAADQCIDAWVGAFTAISADAGFTPDAARITALDAVASIEGALVISATSGRTDTFERVMAALPTWITKVV